MKKILVNSLRLAMRLLPALALTLAVATANSACYYWSYQPDEPEGLAKFM